MLRQLEFDFNPGSDINYIKPVNIPTELEIDEKIDDYNWYRTSKWGDMILDTLPYGWRLYLSLIHI